MYTPRRRSSISEGTHRFTPSKRGQAALDALALGYDVQLPDYSFALLPRSTTSEQALASIISPASVDQVPPSASYREPSNRVCLGSSQGPSQGASEASDRRRFAKCRAETVLYSSPSKDSAVGSLATRSDSPLSPVDSRPSTSSLCSSAPQHAPSSPTRDHSLPGPTHQEQLTSALSSIHTSRSVSHSPAQSEYARRQSASRNRPSPPKPPVGTTQQRMGIHTPMYGEPAFREHQWSSSSASEWGVSARSSPVKSTASLLVTPSAYSSGRRSKSPTPLRIDTERLNQRNAELAFTTPDPRYLQTRSAALPLFPSHSLYNHDDDILSQGRRGFPKSSSQYRHSISTAHPSSSYYSSTLPTIDEPRFLSVQNTRPQYPNPDSSAHLRHLGNRSQLSQFGGSHCPESPSLSSTSAVSPYRPPEKLMHHAHSTHNFAPSSSGKSASPRTPSTSPPVDLEDEDFRVHPERAAIPRMESLLMLSACRHEAESRWPAGSPNVPGLGHEVVGLGMNVGHVGNAGMNGNVIGLDQRGVVYSGCNAYGSAYAPEFGDRPVQTLGDMPYPFGFQAGPVPPNHYRATGGSGGRGRQRSDSMHAISPQRRGPRPNSPSRYRQSQSHTQSPQRNRRPRSMSWTVQGLSAEAVKKLRAYETTKGRGGGRTDSLGEMVGIDTLVMKRQGSKEGRPKKVGRSLRVTKASLSSTEAPTPIETDLSVVPEKNTTPIATLSNLAPHLPTSVPLPPSPPLSPSQIPLPPSPSIASELALVLSSPAVTKAAPSIASPLVSSESFMKYRASQGIESPRPVRTRQNTVVGRTVPTLRLISSPEKGERLALSHQLDAVATGDSHVGSEGANAPENLKPEPAIERIITPPPSFWSPPPLSPAVRTSAPLLPAPTIGSSRRTMSVPPPPGAGEPQTDDVRRAWSCEPPLNAEGGVGRSFAGDWNQSMVIEVSDEEDEEDMVTDASSSEDESELEEGVIDLVNEACNDLDGAKVEACLNGLVERLEPDRTVPSPEDAVDCIRSGGEASKYYASKGSSPSSSGSGANAVEAVQSAIVKLAMDNAGPNHSQRLQSLQAKHTTAPPSSAAHVPRYPINPHRPQKQLVDHPLYAQAAQVQASINAYFDPPSGYKFQPSVPAPPSNYPKSNPALDSLRSGLEKRVAASASAIEEAVRARSASPVVAKQSGWGAPAHTSLAALPPRLQRLHGMTAWTSPKLPLAQLEIPPFSRSASSSLPSAHSHRTASPMPSPVMAQSSAVQWPVIPQAPGNHVKQAPPPPSVGPGACLSYPSPSLPAALPVTFGKKGRPTHLQDIVVDPTPIPAPATAPLVRSKKPRHGKRRSADEASPQAEVETKPAVTSVLNNPPPQPSTPIVEPPQEPMTPSSSRPSDSVSSPPTKSRSRQRQHNRHFRSKKRNLPAQQEASQGASATAANPPPPTAPTVLPPQNPVETAPPLTSIQENSTTANGPRKKKRYYKRPKTNNSTIPAGA